MAERPSGALPPTLLITPEQLEELRLLTNSDMDSRRPFAGILLGQPSLAHLLRLRVFATLDQRIAVRYHIGPMDIGDSGEYLRHHLALAGRSDQLFADDAIVRLHRQANGIPRALNNAAKRCAHRRRLGWQGDRGGRQALGWRSPSSRATDQRRGGGVSRERCRHVSVQSCRIVTKAWPPTAPQATS